MSDSKLNQDAQRGNLALRDNTLLQQCIYQAARRQASVFNECFGSKTKPFRKALAISSEPQPQGKIGCSYIIGASMTYVDIVSISARAARQSGESRRPD